ncbi:hypothetical protein [Burkholderia cepacia]|uniref:hypothetical protein n=1 Tax=Burkholderia cepacia TaxID=292 RepID=UPI0021481C27|nr:hypothetical protein [Burkholderia cepacia]
MEATSIIQSLIIQQSRSNDFPMIQLNEFQEYRNRMIDSPLEEMFRSICHETDLMLRYRRCAHKHASGTTSRRIGPPPSQHLGIARHANRSRFFASQSG